MFNDYRIKWVYCIRSRYVNHKNHTIISRTVAALASEITGHLFTPITLRFERKHNSASTCVVREVWKNIDAWRLRRVSTCFLFRIAQTARRCASRASKRFSPNERRANGWFMSAFISRDYMFALGEWISLHWIRIKWMC